MLRTLALVLLAILAIQAEAADDKADPPRRIAVINWDLTQTLLALGIEPVAIASAGDYRKWVASPPLPPDAVDVGRRIEPNLDILAATDPDLIVMSGYYNRGREQIERIAATETLQIYQPDSDALERSLEVAERLAQRLDRGPQMERLRANLEQAVDRLRARTQSGDTVYVVRFRDDNHIQVFGRHGLFDGVLRRANLVNAWRGKSNYWGFSMIPLERLDAAADHLVVVEPVPHEAEVMMRDSAIWRALPAVRSGRVHRLPPIWSFGGVPSAIRFADRLGAAIRDDG